MFFEVFGMSMQNTIFLVVCAFLLGIAAGGYVISLRQAKKPGGESQAGEILRLRKNPANGSLEVEIAGKTYRSASDLSSMQRSLAGYAVQDLRSWLSLPAETSQTSETIVPAATTATVVAASAVVPVTPDSATAQPVSTPPTNQPVVAPPAQSGDLELPGSPAGKSEKQEDAQKRKRGGLLGVFTRALAAETPSHRVIESIAVQVNQILQKKLKGTPLENRGVCLMELPGQDMVVMIGMDKYDSVSAVPDDEIRAVIQSSVNDWLARSTK
jgi:hypothetical protein